MVLKI